MSFGIRKIVCRGGGLVKMNWYRYLPDPGKYQRKEIVLIRLDCQCDNIKFRKLKFEIVKEISKHGQETESR